MITITSIIGNIFHDKELADKFEMLRRTKNYESIIFSRTELNKTRLRRITNKGTDVGIVLNSKKLENGDVIFSDSQKFIIVEQIPEKVIIVKTNPPSKNSDVLVTLGHIIGNRHRPIQVDKDGQVIFPILANSELEVFKTLFSPIINKIELEVDERIFVPKNGMDVHEH
jgi:urease accessory protein